MNVQQHSSVMYNINAQHFALLVDLKIV